MTMLYLPKYMEAEFNAPHTEVAGRFTFAVSKANTGEVVQRGFLKDIPSPNLITNRGLEVMTKTGFSPAIFVGTGNTPPAVGDITLQSYLAHTITTQVGWNVRTALGGAPDYWVEGAGTWRFAAGVAAGNLTEVGYGSIITTSPLDYQLFSRALIVDSSGNPVTLTILPDEVLDVTYTLRGYANPNNFNSTLVVSGITYDVVTSRWQYNQSGVNPSASFGMFVNTPYLAYGGASIAFNGGITSTSAFTGETGAPTNSVSASNAYVTGENRVICTTSAGLNSSNAPGGLRGITYTLGNSLSTPAGIMSSQYRAIITPAIPKDGTKILTFGISASWGRKTP